MEASGGKNSQLHLKDAENDKSAEVYLQNHAQDENEAALRLNVIRIGLKNEAADCFLNVVIQSLWHLREFREEFIVRSANVYLHNHNEISCIVCSLYEIFDALRKASVDNREEAVSPTPLRIALSNCIRSKYLFEEGQKDASEFLNFILEYLHESLLSTLKTEEEKHQGSLDCGFVDCYTHRMFGIDHQDKIYYHHEIGCALGHVKGRYRRYLSLSLNIRAYNLRTMKNTRGNVSFDELLAEVNEETCEYCGKKKEIYSTVWYHPAVLMIILIWEKADESSEDISLTLSALADELDLSRLFVDYTSGNMYFLHSMVCFAAHRQHYICFIYHYELKIYVQYDDTNVKVIGSWDDVVSTCNALHLQPTILFFYQKLRLEYYLANGFPLQQLMSQRP